MASSWRKYKTRKRDPSPQNVVLLVIDLQNHFSSMANPILYNALATIDLCRCASIPVLFTRHVHKSLTTDTAMLGEWWNELQLQLYGLYKIATEGACTAPQPSALKMTARAKWQAWQKMGAMPAEEAMEKYIDLVTHLYPAWVEGGSKGRNRSGDAAGSNARAPMGPVFSSLVYEEESENELTIDAVHAFAREGEVENLLKCIESGIPVNARDSEGRTPLHWAIDRGHLNVAKALVDNKADVNAKDNEGQTALHYAVVCEREALAEFLVKQKADTSIKDEDGNSPLDLCESEWSWMREKKDSD